MQLQECLVQPHTEKNRSAKSFRRFHLQAVLLRYASNGHMPLCADFPNDNDLIQLEQIFKESLMSRPHPCQFQELVPKQSNAIESSQKEHQYYF